MISHSPVIDYRSPIKIAGAGISGLTCAINLRKAGHEVVVFERQSDSGSRFSNDFQGFENWSSDEDVIPMLRRLNINADFRYEGFKEVDLIDNSLQIHRIRSRTDRNGIYMVKRGKDHDSVDQRLKNQALELGVPIHFNAAVKEEDVDVVATGPKFASGVVCGLKGTTDSGNRISIMMDNSCAPKGYVYLSVIDGKITLASVIMEDFGNANTYAQRAIEKLTHLYGLRIERPQYFGGFGNFFLKESYVKGGRMYVGESAGLQDCLFGFGMRYAFVSGYLASRSVVEGTDYESLLRLELGSIMKCSLVNRYRFEKLGTSAQRMLLKRWATCSDPLGYLRSWYTFTWAKKCIYPISKKWYDKKLENLSPPR